MAKVVHVAPEVEDALAAGGPVVALETSVVAHGLPAPDNLEAARRSAAAVRDAGALPAFIGVIGGRLLVGATEADLERLGDPSTGAAKAGARDLAALVTARRDAGTTVSATVATAALVGIRVVATGGIGGVHRTPPGPAVLVRDVSSDLFELARGRVCVVCAGPKAILDVEATAEELETLGVLVVGLRTSQLPAFFVGASGIPLEHRVEDEAGAAAVLRVHWDGLGRPGGVLLCVAPPDTLPRDELEPAIAAALARAIELGMTGKKATPFLLAAVDRATAGVSRRANLALLERNARVAGGVAVALSGR